MWKLLFWRNYTIFAGFGGLFLHKYLNTYSEAETVLDTPDTSLKTMVVFALLDNLWERKTGKSYKGNNQIPGIEKGIWEDT